MKMKKEKKESLLQEKFYRKKRKLCQGEKNGINNEGREGEKTKRRKKRKKKERKIKKKDRERKITIFAEIRQGKKEGTRKEAKRFPLVLRFLNEINNNLVKEERNER